VRRLSYHFGTGRSPVHRHVSAADADVAGGRAAGPDAVRLDFDGDGRVDDLLWDADGDGRADRALLDLDDDGHAERGFTDPSGRGVWDAPVPVAPVGPVPGGSLSWTDVRGRAGAGRAVRDSDGDGRADAVAADVDHDARSAELVCDLDGDGRAEQLLVDHDRDGVFESAYLSSTGPAGRWDVLLADTDSDGAVETAVAEDASGWVPP
jgi:hypothetical protein